LQHRAQYRRIFSTETRKRHRKRSYLALTNTPEREEENEDNMISSNSELIRNIAAKVFSRSSSSSVTSAGIRKHTEPSPSTRCSLLGGILGVDVAVGIQPRSVQAVDGRHTPKSFQETRRYHDNSLLKFATVHQYSQLLLFRDHRPDEPCPALHRRRSSRAYRRIGTKSTKLISGANFSIKRTRSETILQTNSF
jgi:hypothetical protein